MVAGPKDTTVKGKILLCVTGGLTGVESGVAAAVVVEVCPVLEVEVCGAVFEVSPCVSGCDGLRRACISGSAKTRHLYSIFLCFNQLIISCPFCWVVKGSTGLMGGSITT